MLRFGLLCMFSKCYVAFKRILSVARPLINILASNTLFSEVLYPFPACCALYSQCWAVMSKANIKCWEVSGYLEYVQKAFILDKELYPGRR